VFHGGELPMVEVVEVNELKPLVVPDFLLWIKIIPACVQEGRRLISVWEEEGGWIFFHRWLRVFKRLLRIFVDFFISLLCLGNLF
jgi:hypothetical protein